MKIQHLSFAGFIALTLTACGGGSSQSASVVPNVQASSPGLQTTAQPTGLGISNVQPLPKNTAAGNNLNAYANPNAVTSPSIGNPPSGQAGTSTTFSTANPLSSATPASPMTAPNAGATSGNNVPQPASSAPSSASPPLTNQPSQASSIPSVPAIPPTPSPVSSPVALTSPSMNPSPTNSAPQATFAPSASPSPGASSAPVGQPTSVPVNTPSAPYYLPLAVGNMWSFANGITISDSYTVPAFFCTGTGKMVPYRDGLTITAGGNSFVFEVARDRGQLVIVDAFQQTSLGTTFFSDTSGSRECAVGLLEDDGAGDFGPTTLSFGFGSTVLGTQIPFQYGNQTFATTQLLTTGLLQTPQTDPVTGTYQQKIRFSWNWAFAKGVGFTQISFGTSYGDGIPHETNPVVILGSPSPLIHYTVSPNSH